MKSTGRRRSPRPSSVGSGDAGPGRERGERRRRRPRHFWVATLGDGPITWFVAPDSLLLQSVIARLSGLNQIEAGPYMTGPCLGRGALVHALLDRPSTQTWMPCSNYRVPAFAPSYGPGKSASRLAPSISGGLFDWEEACCRGVGSASEGRRRTRTDPAPQGSHADPIRLLACAADSARLVSADVA